MSDPSFFVHSHNPRCFLYQRTPFKIVTLARHYGVVFNADLDWDVFLPELQSRGSAGRQLPAFQD